MLTQANDLIRKRFVIEQRDDNKIKIGKRFLINFSSSDYLNLATHPAVKKAFIEGVHRYGAGSGAAAQVSGFYRAHKRLEEKFAEFLKRDRAILFGSGYLANLGVMTALTNRHHMIFADKFCHASILDGIHLSRAKYLRYAHNNIQHLKTLTAHSSKGNVLITESVFSMGGDICALKELIHISQMHQMQLIVDDAHGAGVLGENGRGISEYFHCTQKEIPCLIVPLGKAFASMGCIVSGNHELIECLLQFARTYRYATALPPAIASATIATLKIIEQENWRRHQLNQRIEFFIREVKKHALQLISQDITPIKSILIGDNKKAMKIKQALMKKGFFIACIRPSSVPIGTARLRISLNTAHKEQDIVQLLDLIANYHVKFSE